MNDRGVKDEYWEQWECSDCGYTDTGPIDRLIGKNMAVEVGRGRRKKTVETVVCPNCDSRDWHSESVRDLIDGLTG